MATPLPLCRPPGHNKSKGCNRSRTEPHFPFVILPATTNRKVQAKGAKVSLLRPGIPATDPRWQPHYPPLSGKPRVERFHFSPARLIVGRPEKPMTRVHLSLLLAVALSTPSWAQISP